MFWASQSVSAAIRSANARTTANVLTRETTARQVGHKPARVAGLVGGPLIDAERRADDPVNLKPAIGGADPEGCRTPACRRLCALLVPLGLLHAIHARMPSTTHCCLLFSVRSKTSSTVPRD